MRGREIAVVRRLVSLVTALGFVLATLLGPAGAAPALAAGKSAPVDPILKQKAQNDGGATVPVIIERSDENSAVAAVQAKGGKVKRSLKAHKGLVADVSASSLDALSREPGVTRIAFDAPMTLKGEVDWDARPLESVYPSVVGASEVWASGVMGQGVGVAIVDSGLRDHDDFKDADARNNNRRSGRSRLAERFAVQVRDQGGDDDDQGHGTWVAGIVGGRGWDDAERKDQATPGKYAGVAPGVELIGVKVANKRGVSRLSDAVAGVEWVIANRDRYNIRVMNLSLVSTVAESYHTSVLDAVVEQAWLSGIVVVVAAGNEGPNTMLYPPANDPFAIVVGATDDNGTVDRADDQRVWFSSYGTTQDGVVKPDLVAPGRRIVSTLGSRDLPLARQFPDRIVRGHYLRLSGTSASAPVVSGVVALLLQARPGLRPDEVKWLLQKTAAPVAGDGTGAGYAQANAAVRYGGEIGRANRDVVPNVYIQRAFLARTGKLGPPGTSWDSSSWSTSSWSQSDWNSSSWSTSSWSQADWDSTSWSSSSWATSSWSSSSWGSSIWNSSSWNSSSWNSSSWSNNGWDSTSWSANSRD